LRRSSSACASTEMSIATEVTGQTLPSGMCSSLPLQDSRLTFTSLPLLNDNGAGLAIAVSTYLDEVNRHGKKKNERTPSEDTKEEVRSNFGWLPQVPNVTKNLKSAFSLWDAVRISRSLRVLLVEVNTRSGLHGFQGSRKGDEECKGIGRGKCMAFGYAVIRTLARRLPPSFRHIELCHMS
jgi:Temperature dependent protein affecting M2 dsRNA replication